jgi:hypothetical protein
MKFVNKILACGVAMMVTAIAADLQAQGMQPSKAKVRKVQGDAQYKANAAADWAPLKAGAVLNPGAIIETGKGAQVDLFLADIGSVVRVTEATTVGIDKLAFAKVGGENVVETELNLKSGTILGNVKKLAAASRYDVKIPNGVCGIRGTEFKVSASGVVYVVTGTVRVTYTPQGGQPIVRDVQAGQIFIPPTAAGEQPTVRAIDLADPVWKEIKDLGTTPPPTMQIEPLPVPTERPNDQPGHPTGAPTSNGG